VRIDPKNRPLVYASYSTFHPTFLYEMLWNLALCALLIWIDRKRRLRPGNILPLYIGGYFLGRLWIEAMRIDTATKIFGIRVNIWLSIIGIGGALIALVARGLWRRPDDDEEPYLDGHRWVDPRLAVDEGADDADGSGADGLTDEPGESGAPDEPDEPGPGDGDEVAVESGGPELSDEPAEGPPPT